MITNNTAIQYLKPQVLLSSRQALSILWVIALVVFSADTCPAEIKRPMPSELKFSSITFNPPKPEKIELKNGMILFFLEDHELPVLNISALVRTGSIYEPKEKIGLASLASTVMRTGGTASMTGDEIDEKLEFIAGSIGLHSGYTNVGGSLSILKKDIDLGLQIFADILMKPVFEQEKLEMAKKTSIEGIRRKNDDPGSIARREFRKLLYAGHPFAHEPTIKSVSSITRDDLIAFHGKYLYPNRMILAVSGDLSRDEVLKKVEGAFGGWESKTVKLPKIEPVKKNFRRSVNYINKDRPQSVIRVGHLGVKISNPDHYALQLMDDILGGNSFQSRLMQDIRTDRGLAYSVWSYFGAGVYDYDAFTMGAETKAPSTTEVIELILAQVRKMRNGLVSEKELENAKKFIENSFVFKFTTSAKIVGRMAFFEFYDIPRDYLDTYLGNIRKVTREDIKRVAQEYLRPDEIIITVVGDREKFEKPLSTFGEVNTIELEKFE